MSFAVVIANYNRSDNAETMGSNPVEVPKFFSG